MRAVIACAARRRRPANMVDDAAVAWGGTSLDRRLGPLYHVVHVPIGTADVASAVRAGEAERNPLMQTRFSADRLVNAPAAVVYHLLADYHEHHRPGGFLPPAFTDQVVEAGGFGAGTRIRL